MSPETGPLFDRSQPLTADVLASRFFAQHPHVGTLSHKQARWLSDVWIRSPHPDPAQSRA